MYLQLIKKLASQSYLRPISNTALVNVARFSSGAKATEDDEPIQMESPFQREPRKCILCQMNIKPDYKNVRLLSQFQSSYTARTYGRHITGLCMQKQIQVEAAIKKAKFAGYMPSYHKYPEFLTDPMIFDPENPIKPHPY